MRGKACHFLLPGLAVLTALAGVMAYPHLPERFDSHWNAAGEADGSMPKFWGVALFPILMAGIFVRGSTGVIVFLVAPAVVVAIITVVYSYVVSEMHGP